MRGDDPQQAAIFSYISPEERVPQDHPLHTMRVLVEAVLKALSPQFDRLYSDTGRPSIARKNCCGHSCYRVCLWIVGGWSMRYPDEIPRLTLFVRRNPMDHDLIVEQLLDRCKRFLENILQASDLHSVAAASLAIFRAHP
jgi:hypothetical protein